MKFLFLSLLLSFLNVPEIDLSEIKTPDFDILLLAFDDLMDKPWFLRAGFESVRVGGELAIHARKGHYDKLKVKQRFFVIKRDHFSVHRTFKNSRN